jgi:CBS domain-containing protein
MRVVGILSERDIVRAVAQSGPRVLDAPVSDVMTRAVIMCREEDTIEHLMREMTRGRFRHLPVVDSTEKLCGIISIGDVVKHHVEDVERDADALRAYIAHA